MNKLILLLILCASCSNPPSAEYQAKTPIRLMQLQSLQMKKYSSEADLFIAYLWPTEKYFHQLVKDNDQDDYQVWLSKIARDIIQLGNEMGSLNREQYNKNKYWEQRSSCLKCDCVIYAICQPGEDPNFDNFDQCFAIDDERAEFFTDNYRRQAEVVASMQTRLDPIPNDTPHWITTSTTFAGNSINLRPQINWDSLELTIPLFYLDQEGNALAYSTKDKSIAEVRVQQYEGYQQLRFNLKEKLSGHDYYFELDLTENLGKLRAFGEIIVKENNQILTRGFASLEFPSLNQPEIACRSTKE